MNDGSQAWSVPSVLVNDSLDNTGVQYPIPSILGLVVFEKYRGADSALVTLTVFNTLGQRVATLVNGQQEAGYHDVRFDGSGLASGVYFYRLQAGGFVQSRRLVILR